MQSHEKKPPLSHFALKLDFFQKDIWLSFFLIRAKKGLKKLLITVRIPFNQITVWVCFFSTDELTWSQCDLAKSFDIVILKFFC